jgi:hypothetical protein
MALRNRAVMKAPEVGQWLVTGQGETILLWEK